MAHALFTKLNQIRKKKYFDSLFKPRKKYAFIGVGIHSLTNLYPLLHYFGVDLKYICTEKSSWEKMNYFFPASRLIHSLKDITADEEIEGVFVSASPQSHYNILIELFKSGKKVFVEKPPCSNLSELSNLVNLSKNNVCKVGLQRKYWPGNELVHKNIQSAKTYIYQFHFGPYLHGDPFTELFIHALHYCIHLFGEYAISSFSHKKNNKSITTQIHVEHKKGISGLIELSTDFSWTAPTDHLSVNCEGEILEIGYPAFVKGYPKPRRLFNIPAERLLHQPVLSKEYFSIQNLIIPAVELNTLMLQGFYNEINTFIKITENKISDQPINDLPELIEVYRVIEELKKNI